MKIEEVKSQKVAKQFAEQKREQWIKETYLDIIYCARSGNRGVKKNIFVMSKTLKVLMFAVLGIIEWQLVELTRALVSKPLWVKLSLELFLETKLKEKTKTEI